MQRKALGVFGVKRTRVPGTKALLHASHPQECPDCGEQMVTVNWVPECHTCETVRIFDAGRGPDGKFRIFPRDLPKKALYPNRAARRKARL